MSKTPDRMSDLSFRLMTATFAVIDAIYPRVDRRALGFGIPEGITLVDYGCGPGRYALRFARLVGPGGLVYAVDVQPLALQAVQRKMAANHLENVVPVLAHGYSSGLPDQVADLVCALDMFFGLHDPTAFLGEVRRILKADGLLILDDGHQPRRVTKEKIRAAGGWQIVLESTDHLRCQPV
jgi:ubiquinone/menaquinone biosynthesis C-methylase UbiE